MSGLDIWVTAREADDDLSPSLAFTRRSGLEYPHGLMLKFNLYCKVLPDGRLTQ